MEPLERFTVPTRYDAAPYGSLCMVKKDDGRPEYYIQKSTDPEVADWERFGIFLEHLFEEDIKDSTFIKECLKRDESKRIGITIHLTM